MNQILDNLYKELSRFDCGSNSCHFAKTKIGMRTNSGCRCLRDVPFDLMRSLVTFYRNYQTSPNKVVNRGE